MQQLQPMFSILDHFSGGQFNAEWPSWSRQGIAELRNEFELGIDSPAWNDPLAGFNSPEWWGR